MADKAQKNCFVIMGFGIKTDLATGRKLNLDKSYQALIKPVVEKKGITCFRADEIRHSGSIDLQMYEQLLTADLVIADISTANVNAFYELGIRHALKPYSTIIISEDQLGYPFDLTHITINKYTHLGDSIDYFEVLRFQKLLEDTIDSVLANSVPDSPVYTFLDDLIPPHLKASAENVVKQIGDVLTAKKEDAAAAQNPDDQTLSIIIKQAEDALKNKKFDLAKVLFDSALKMLSYENDPHIIANNTYIVQRLALATYQAKQPDEITALKDSITLLRKIDLDHTNDPETVALAGSIEKHLFEQGEGDSHLDSAILYYQRGYYLLHNRHNGINLAYLLNCRATTSLDASRDEKIADIVWANRMRRDVLSLCEKDAAKITAMESQAQSSTEQISEEQKEIISEQKFWILVNKAEAHFGLGQLDEYEKAAADAKLIAHDDWMMDSFSKQLEKLKALIVKQQEMV